MQGWSKRAQSCDNIALQVRARSRSVYPAVGLRSVALRVNGYTRTLRLCLSPVPLIVRLTPSSLRVSANSSQASAAESSADDGAGPALGAHNEAPSQTNVPPPTTAATWKGRKNRSVSWDDMRSGVSLSSRDMSSVEEEATESHGSWSSSEQRSRCVAKEPASRGWFCSSTRHSTSPAQKHAPNAEHSRAIMRPCCVRMRCC